MVLYTTLKMAHLVGVVIFLGNIVVTAWWKVKADRTNDVRIIAFSQRQVTLTDFLFTFTGAGLALIGGAGMAHLRGLNYTSSGPFWLVLGFWLFVASGVIWVAVLIPLQVKLARLVRQMQSSGVVPPEFGRLSALWYVFGAISTALPLGNLYLMVFRPV